MTSESPVSPRPESRWPAAFSVIVVIVVRLVLPDTLTFGPRWILPAIEAVLLVALLAANPNQLTRESRDMRRFSLALTCVIAAANAASLARLVNALLNGSATSGRQLILSSLGIWLTNVVVFALLYWDLDRHGPRARSIGEDVEPELLFPQMTLDQPQYAVWRPHFEDYLYVSFTNSTAFSPTDTMPLSGRIKMAMLVQSLLSLVTIALVGARAVNILG
jgi:uncharacterized membrane protein